MPTLPPKFVALPHSLKADPTPPDWATGSCRRTLVLARIWWPLTACSHTADVLRFAECQTPWCDELSPARQRQQGHKRFANKKQKLLISTTAQCDIFQKSSNNIHRSSLAWWRRKHLPWRPEHHHQSNDHIRKRTRASIHNFTEVWDHNGNPSLQRQQSTVPSSDVPHMTQYYCYQDPGRLDQDWQSSYTRS